MLDNCRQIRLSMFLVLALLAASNGSYAAVSATPLTNNTVNSFWGPAHSTMVGDRLIWVEHDRRVWFRDGSTTVPVQDFDGNVPELDLVSSFVFGLGSGASAGEVVGAWRRGADFAWVWTSGQVPVLVDTPATNPFVPGGATNPEGIAIADGCVFLITQAQDPGDGTGNIYKNVFQVSTADGSVTPVSGNLRAFGAGRVRTSGCRAVWVQDVNDDILVTGQPHELQYWDGATTVTLDSGAIDKFDLDLEDSKIVYVKQVEGRDQLFLIDLDGPSLLPVQLTDTLPSKGDPQTDGRHVAWGEEVTNPEGGVPLMDLRLLGGLRVGPLTAQRPHLLTNAFTLDAGQLAWRGRGEPGTTTGQLVYLADNQREILDPGFYGLVDHPFLSDGWLAWDGIYPGEAKYQISLGRGTQPHDLGQAPPPIYVEVVPGPGNVTIRWDEVLDVDGYTVYLAEESGLTPSNWATLQGGARYPGVSSPLTIGGLDPTRTHYAIVTSTENGTEGPSSGEVETFATVVDTIDDTTDDDSMDGVCQDNQGNCSLRAALMQASASGERVPTVVVPAGTYTLTLPGTDDAGAVGDLDVLGPMTIVGAGAGQTIVSGGGSVERILHVDPNREGFLVRVADLTLRDADQGIRNNGELRMDHVRVFNNGSTASIAIGAAIESRVAERLELFDCELDGNTTSSHGGAMLLDASVDIWRTTVHDNFAGLGGGAVYMFGGDVRWTDSILRDNSTRINQNWPGGAINQENGNLLLRRSAIVGNDAPDCGGGIFKGGGRLTLVNSTVSGNHSDDEGGAICTYGSDPASGGTELIGSTLAGNSATTYPTLELGGGTLLKLDYSILRNELGQSDCHPVSTLGTSMRGLSFGAMTDCTGSNPLASTADPLLDVLAANGGATPTHALLPGSPALEAVAGADCINRFYEPLGTDQRGAARPIDHDDDGEARCDSGAYEAPVACIDADADGFPTIATSGCLSGAPVDCDDGDSQSWATPGENVLLRFVGRDTLVWNPPADPGGVLGTLVHEVARSDRAYDFATDVTCSTLASGMTSLTDVEDPIPGTLYFYLSRAANACPGASSWGSASSGIGRSVTCP